MNDISKYINTLFEKGRRRLRQVKPLLDISFPLDWEDSENENETSLGEVDMLSMEKAQQACAVAVQGSGSLPNDTDDKTINFLQRRSMVDVLEDGQVVLARDVIRHGLLVSNAVLERNLRDVPTTLEMQDDLRERGWTFSTDLKAASIEHKTAIDDNPTTYYTLLTHFCDIMGEYEAENNFHHKQSEPYYKTLELAATSCIDDIIDIPPYKSAKYYQQLQIFLVDASLPDPRQEEANNTNRRTL